MKPKTEELLYLLLWSCDRLARPTFRKLTDSFEAWAYRNGFLRQLAELERQKFLEAQAGPGAGGVATECLLRLTEAGRLHVLGGRDPESHWRRVWDGYWRLVLYDLPVAQSPARDRLRKYLRQRGLGRLQNSVWISPDPLQEDHAIIANGRVDVGSLLLLEARRCTGDRDEEIVAGAWDFAEINRGYAKHLKVLEARPTVSLRDEATALALRRWAHQERAAWLVAVKDDPLLPSSLLPDNYLGRKAWQARVKVLREAANQMRRFQKW